MDDIQRGLLGTFGGGLVLGGIAWVGTVSMAWPLRVIPALMMFMAGGGLLVVAWRGGNSPGAILRRAIAGGRELQRITDSETLVNSYLAWRDTTYQQLRDRWGDAEAIRFKVAGDQVPGQDFRPVAAAQVSYLEGLRKRRARR